MAAYMILVEGYEMSSRTSAITEELGIGQIEFQENHLTWQQTGGGPGGNPGMLGFWMDPENAGLRGYEPENQTWVPSPDGKFWIGTINDRPLVPADVLRLKPHANSTYVLLEDGNKWAIPAARSLPTYWAQDANGIGILNYKPRFVEFCKQAEKIFEVFTGYSGEGDALVSGPWPYVCESLALNYRLAPAIISALQLIGDESGPAIMKATVEWDKILEAALQKKTELQSQPGAT